MINAPVDSTAKCGTDHTTSAFWASRNHFLGFAYFNVKDFVKYAWLRRQTLKHNYFGRSVLPNPFSGINNFLRREAFDCWQTKNNDVTKKTSLILALQIKF